MPVPSRFRNVLIISLVVCSACVWGCDRDDDVRVYSAPRDAPPVAHARPIAWRLPPGWVEIPDQTGGQFGRFATIQLAGDDPTLLLTVNMLEGAGATDLLPNFNRWEGQLGLQPSTPTEAAAKAKAIAVEGHSAYRMDLAGTDVKTAAPARWLGVLLPEGGRAWSFLLKGTPEKIAEHESAFDAFIASINFPAHDHSTDTPSVSATRPGAAPSTGPAVAEKSRAMSGFTLPAGWARDTAERNMRVATFNVGSGNGQAELIVTKFAIDRFGSMLDNVNRWRREVGLPPTDDEFKENVREIQAAGASTLVFDFAGPRTPAGEKRSYVAMLKQGPDIWFFKLIGSAETVAGQQANFDAFLQSLKFGEAGE